MKCMIGMLAGFRDPLFVILDHAVCVNDYRKSSSIAYFVVEAFVCKVLE